MFSMVIDSRSDVYGNAVGRASLPYCPTPQKGKTDLNRAVPLCILLLFCAFLQEKQGYPTPCPSPEIISKYYVFGAWV